MSLEDYAVQYFFEITLSRSSILLNKKLVANASFIVIRV